MSGTNCPNCGAPIEVGGVKCPFCETPYFTVAVNAEEIYDIQIKNNVKKMATAGISPAMKYAEELSRIMQKLNAIETETEQMGEITRRYASQCVFGRRR